MDRPCLSHRPFFLLQLALPTSLCFLPRPSLWDGRPFVDFGPTLREAGTFFLLKFLTYKVHPWSQEDAPYEKKKEDAPKASPPLPSAPAVPLLQSQGQHPCTSISPRSQGPEDPHHHSPLPARRELRRLGRRRAHHHRLSWSQPLDWASTRGSSHSLFIVFIRVNSKFFNLSTPSASCCL